jgi:aspartyl-tRNA synthetase
MSEVPVQFVPEAVGMRSAYCGSLRTADIGRTVTVCGWVGRRREHGEHLAFLDVRDHSGVLQCVVDGAHSLRSE